jgi:hypothetical protein
MTQAIVRLKQPDTRNRWIDESPINQWLNENFGPGESRRKAKYKQRLGMLNTIKDILNTILLANRMQCYLHSSGHESRCFC